MIKQDIPKIIRKLEASGMTQRQIAAKVGVSHATINRIKNGYTKPNYQVGESLVFLTCS